MNASGETVPECRRLFERNSKLPSIWRLCAAAEMSKAAKSATTSLRHRRIRMGSAESGEPSHRVRGVEIVNFHFLACAGKITFQPSDGKRTSFLLQSLANLVSRKASCSALAKAITKQSSKCPASPVMKTGHHQSPKQKTILYAHVSPCTNIEN